MGYKTIMRRKRPYGEGGPPLWTLSDLMLCDVPAGLIAIGITKPFAPQGALGYLNHTLDLILDRLGEKITGEQGERILISTTGRWKAPWVLLYGLGRLEGLNEETISHELHSLAEDLAKLKLTPPAFLLPGYDPYRWGTPQEAARLLIEAVPPPGILWNPRRDILYRIHYHCKGPFNYLLRVEARVK